MNGGISMKAYVQVYTGEGKGKTTAAIGLAIRAIGAGKKVLFLQFMKSKVYSEHTILPTLTNLTLEPCRLLHHLASHTQPYIRELPCRVPHVQPPSRAIKGNDHPCFRNG